MMNDSVKKVGKKSIFRRIAHRKNLPMIVYLLLLIAVTINVSYRGGAFSYVLFYCVLLYIPISLIHMVYTVLALRVYQETDKKLIPKNSSVGYQFTIENAWIIPISEVRFVYDSEITFFGEDFTNQSYSLLPKGKQEVNSTMKFLYAGSYDAGIESYYIQDMFGIIRLKKKVGIPIRVHVLPVITDVARNDIENISSSNNGNLFSMNTLENSLGNDVRKYVEGDSMNTVHWKLYARTGDMYSRLPEHQESEMVSMILVTEVSDSTIESIKQRDSFLEYLISACEYFGMKKKPLMIVYYYVGVKTFMIDSPDSFQEFYTEVLIRIGTKQASGFEKEMIEEVSKKNSSVIIFREKECRLESL